MINLKKIKKSFAMICALILVAGLLAPGAMAAEPIELTASSAIVTELTSGTTLVSSQPDLVQNPGSVTKVVSLYALCTALFSGKADLRDEVTITEGMMHSEANVIPVREGEILRYEDLLYLMFMDYSETAAYAAAEYAFGSADNLVAAMNAFADDCGCENTLFTNITGDYDENQHTTPADLVRMLLAASQNSVFMSVFSAKSYTVRDTNKSISRLLTTSNQLQRTGSSYYCAECTGGRFGGTAEGYTTVSLSVDEESGMELIVIVSGALSKDDSYQDAKKLIRWTFDGFSWKTVVNAGENIASVPVDLGRDTDHVVAVPDNDVTVMLDNDIQPEDFTREVILYAGDEGLQAPVEKGQRLGELHLIYQGKEYASAALVAAKPIDLMRIEYLKRTIKDTAKSAGIITLLVVMVVLLGLYLVYAFSYRAYRLAKKGQVSAIKKRLKQERRAAANPRGSLEAKEDTRKLPSPELMEEGLETETDLEIGEETKEEEI